MSGNSPSSLLGVIKDITKKMLEKLKKEGKLGDEELSKLRREFIEEVSRVSKGKCGELKSIEAWLSEVSDALKSLGFAVIAVDAKLEGVGLVGISEGLTRGVLEVGLCWDGVRDVPYFPASGIKGCVRSILLNRCAGIGDESKKLECVELTLKLLGWTSSPSQEEVEGLKRVLKLSNAEQLRRMAREVHGFSHVVFIDSYPIECPNNGGVLVKPWIITPHYAREGVETEYDVNLTPIPHVVISEGSTFKFVVGVDAEGLELAGRLHSILKGEASGSSMKVAGIYLVASTLVAALKSGLGARTAKGYGAFNVVKAKSIRGVNTHEQ